MDIEKVINYGLKEIPKYPFGKPKSAISDQFESTEIVKINSNENSIGVSPKAVQAAVESLSDLNLYPDSTNYELRVKIAKRFGVKAENVFVGNGASEIIYYLALSFLNSGDEVIVPKITYPLYNIAFKMMKATIISSPMDKYRIDVDKMIGLINKKTKMIAICNPNNPTGDTLTKDEMKYFIKKVPENIILVVDEAYMDFADNDIFPDTISLIKNGLENLYIIRTLSKAYGLAGLRVGYGIGNHKINEEMQKVKLPFNISLIAQRAAIAALNDDDFLKKTVDNIKSEKVRIYSELKKMKLNYIKSNTNFILIDVGMDSDMVTEELEKNGILVRNSKSYGMENCIRITVGTEKQNTRFLSVLHDIVGR